MFFESPEWILQIVAAITTAVLTLLVTIFGLRHMAAKSETLTWRKIFWLVPALGLVTVVAQVWAAVAHHNYNTDLVLHYDDRFADLKEERAKAASAIHTYLRLHDWDAVSDPDLDGLDRVLDFFDDLGFDWRHGRIGADVLHQRFYDYLRIYCQETGGYRTAEPTVWENVTPLFDELTRIEARKLRADPAACKWDAETLEESLKIEMRLSSSSARSHGPPRR